MAAAFVLSGALLSRAEASESVERSLTVRAEVSARTSLKVSAEVVRIQVLDPAVPVAASIDFSAGTRTQPGGEVLLLVEPLATMGVPSRPGGVTSPTAPGGDDSQMNGAIDLSTPGPKIARRWIGSGLRRGTVQFTVRAARTGTYEIPVRFVLSAP